jgi:C4-dicarboxylate transporter DctM subunit
MYILVVFLVVFLLLIFLRIPVAFSIGIAGVVGFLIGGLRFSIIASALTSGLDNFALLAIPAFIFAGDLMAQGGISAAIINFLNSFLRRFRGSLGSILVTTSMLFGSITGSSLATITAIGGIMLPEMKKENYPLPYSTAILAASGFLGVLIPPSVPGVVFALSAEQKVTAVWMSTLMPGITLGILYMVMNYIVFGRKQKKNTTPFVFAEVGRNLLSSTPKALVAFVMPFIIFGGVYGGVFTATEAGAVSVLYGLIAGWIIYPLLFNQKPTGKLIATTRKSAVSTASICIIIATATIVGRMIATGGVSTALINFLLSITNSKTVFLIIANLLLLLCGMFLETNSVIIIFTPLLVPIAKAYGVDPVHFGAIELLNLEIGLITPPFAANLFVACGMTKCRIDEVIKPLLPFYACCIPVLLLTTFVPDFTLFFVRLFS